MKSTDIDVTLSISISIYFMSGAYGLSMSWTSLLLAATETPFNMLENDSG
jgi:hypothetical protein